LSATRAALSAARVAHQTFGALGIVVARDTNAPRARERVLPVHALARRIRQAASLPGEMARARELVIAPLLGTP
jgi:hypothetical protein